MKKAILALVAVVFLSGCGDYSDGQRSGVLTKFSHKGLIWKTWEGELVMGCHKSGTDSQGDTSSVANVFEFSAEDSTVIQKLQSNVGNSVTLTYRQEVWIAPWRGDTEYMIADVK